MHLCYANPSFSQVCKMLTKITLEGPRMVLCTPDWGTRGEHTYWRRLWDCMTVGRTELPDHLMYVSEHPQENMPAPDWGSFLFIFDDSLKAVPVSDLD